MGDKPKYIYIKGLHMFSLAFSLRFLKKNLSYSLFLIS